MEKLTSNGNKKFQDTAVSMVRILAVDAVLQSVVHFTFVVNYFCTDRRNRVRQNRRISVEESEFNDVRFIEALNDFVDGQLEGNN